jgi:hypothetical protein
MAAVYIDFRSLLITQRGSVLPSVLRPQNLLGNVQRLGIKRLGIKRATVGH